MKNGYIYLIFTSLSLLVAIMFKEPYLRTKGAGFLWSALLAGWWFYLLVIVLTCIAIALFLKRAVSREINAEQTEILRSKRRMRNNIVDFDKKLNSITNEIMIKFEWLPFPKNKAELNTALFELLRNRLKLREKQEEQKEKQKRKKKK